MYSVFVLCLHNLYKTSSATKQVAPVMHGVWERRSVRCKIITLKQIEINEWFPTFHNKIHEGQEHAR